LSGKQSEGELIKIVLWLLNLLPCLPLGCLLCTLNLPYSSLPGKNQTRSEKLSWGCWANGFYEIFVPLEEMEEFLISCKIFPGCLVFMKVEYTVFLRLQKLIYLCYMEKTRGV